MRFDVQGGHFCVAYFLPLRVIPWLKDRLYHQSSRGLCAADQSQQRFPGSQWYSGPVATDLAEQSVLNGIPFGQGVIMPVSRSASYVVNEYA
jgi:hypothetical protein